MGLAVMVSALTFHGFGSHGKRGVRGTAVSSSVDGRHSVLVLVELEHRRVRELCVLKTQMHGVQQNIHAQSSKHV